VTAQANVKTESTLAPPWSFDADEGDITLHGAPIFRVYREWDFPCIEDEERAAADMEYLAHAAVVVMLLNTIATTTKPTVGAALAEAGQ
jgi:hypothetical protein